MPRAPRGGDDPMTRPDREMLWSRLGAVGSVRWEMAAGTSTKQGRGTIIVQCPDPATIDWQEAGQWQDGVGRPTPYRDRLRWTWDPRRAVVSLHHLRQGEGHPIHLADLVDQGDGRFAPLDPHLCAEDTYRVELRVSDEGVRVAWSVTGPNKEYSLERFYR